MHMGKKHKADPQTKSLFLKFLLITFNFWIWQLYGLYAFHLQFSIDFSF